jgi:hypothetical protein
MKKTLLHFLPVLGIFLAILCVSTGNIQAQTLASGDELSSIPKGPFVAPSTAISYLDAEMIKLKIEMGALPHNSPAYKQSQWKYVYYEHITKVLVDSKATTSEHVGNAIVRGLGIYATDLYGDITYNQKVLNKKAVVDLLKG